nr:hypothetical protein [Tanacetum cinerariifolium]
SVKEGDSPGGITDSSFEDGVQHAMYLNNNSYPYLKVVSAIVSNDLVILVNTRPLKSWKETLDLLCTRIRSSQVLVGHSYNLIDINLRKIVNVETASSQRLSVHEVGSTPFFHVNVYLHLEVDQQDLISLLGDTADQKYPIYMQGLALYTLCTVVIDLDEERCQ